MHQSTGANLFVRQAAIIGELLRKKKGHTWRIMAPEGRNKKKWINQAYYTSFVQEPHIWVSKKRIHCLSIFVHFGVPRSALLRSAADQPSAFVPQK